MTNPNVYVLFRPDDLEILGVYSTCKRALEQQKRTQIAGRGTVIEHAILDEEYPNDKPEE